MKKLLILFILMYVLSSYATMGNMAVNSESVALTTQSSEQTTVASSKPQKKKHRTKPISSVLDSLVLDFSYSGDVEGVIDELKQYDSSLTVRSNLGSKKPLLVNLDLQAVHLAEISDAINSQTNGQVQLVFNANENSIRLVFVKTVDVGKSAVDESLKWQKGGAPRPILNRDGVVLFPYGEYQAVITCQPQNLCDIELQAGEEIQGIVIGDSARWNQGDQSIPIVYSGNGTKLVPHLVLKPSQSGLDTSLLVTTSKRTYMMKLKSANTGAVARVGFYYPNEMMQNFTANKDALRGNASGATQDTVATNPDIQMPLMNLSKLNYHYSQSGDDYPWKPTQIFDDGTSVYIQLPDSVSSRNLPGLCIVAEGMDSDTECEMVNFRFNDHYYIIDRLFEEAKLVNGFDDEAQIITIRRGAVKKGFWARLFGG